VANGQAEIVFDNAEVRKYLEGVTKRFDQVTQRDQAVIGLLSAIVFRDIMKHFDREEGPDSRWKAWSPSYQKFMTSIGRNGNKLLQFSGRLRQAFQPTNVRTSAEGIVWFNPAKTAKGFPYAAAHDEGGGRLPQRTVMWLSGEAMTDIETQILKFLES
jgi:phage gpG-like protein